MATERPKLKIPLTTSDKVIEALCWSGLAVLWVITFLFYAQLPEIIPTHFNGAGQIDGMGSKNTIWLLPAITTILFAGLTVLNRYPHTFNYLEEITPANAERNYRLGTRILRYSKLFLVFLFGAIILQVSSAATQNLTINDKGWMIKGIIVVALVWPLVVLLISFLQYRKNRTLHA